VYRLPYVELRQCCVTLESEVGCSAGVDSAGASDPIKRLSEVLSDLKSIAQGTKH
jgi:hypothetical protein